MANPGGDRASRRIDADRLLNKRGLPDLPDARRMMIEQLRKAGGSSEKVLAAMAQVPRHAFAPPHLWQMAYADVDLWGPTAFLARPRVVARLATALERKRARKVLEYATGSGYVTTILAMIADRVDTVEHDPWLLWLSSDAFRELELDNVSQRASDGRLGWPERAPYDAIVVGAALPRVPARLLRQLKAGGVCIAPVGPYLGPHRQLLIQKTAEGTTVKVLGRCYFPPLIGGWGPADPWWPPMAAEEPEPDDPDAGPWPWAATAWGAWRADRVGPGAGAAWAAWMGAPALDPWGLEGGAPGPETVASPGAPDE